MITLTVKDCNSFSQNFYDSVIASLQFHQLTCSCGHSACLSIHAYYMRKAKAPDGSVHTLRILRVKCSECGTTHAVLLSSMVPYSQISLSAHQAIIDAYESAGDTDHDCTDTGSIDENNVKYIIRTYLRHWKQRLLSAGLPLHPASLLTAGCFAFYSAQFMQIRKTFNILFSMTT